MPTTTVLVPSRHAVAVLAAACLVSACASVDLNQRYDPPPVRLPQALPDPLATAPAVPSGVQSQPVAPAQPVAQPLPPIGAVPPEQPSQPAEPPRPEVHLVTLTSPLDAVSVVPPTRSSGSGQIDALYDSSTRILRWKASWTGLSGVITGVQFHGPAIAGQSAPPAMVWPGPYGPRYEGRATLTPQQAVELLDGRWYVNVMTNIYPAGEVRGQMRIVR